MEIVKIKINGREKSNTHRLKSKKVYEQTEKEVIVFKFLVRIGFVYVKFSKRSF